MDYYDRKRELFKKISTTLHKTTKAGVYPEQKWFLFEIERDLGMGGAARKFLTELQDLNQLEKIKTEDGDFLLKWIGREP